MEAYLYEDLYQTEETHWWHLSKRALVVETLWRFVFQFKQLRLGKNKPRILDIGCGTGKNMEELSRFAHVYGVDQSAEAARFCHQRGLSKVFQGQAARLPFPDQTFEMVTLLDVLEHIDESDLIEINRVIKSNGILLITVPAFNWLWSKWDEVLHHRRRYTVPQLIKVVQSFGFEPVKFGYLHAFLVIPAWLVRLVKSVVYKDQYPSDFKVGSKLINQLGVIWTDIERSLFWRFGLPIGTSVIGISRKIDNATNRS